MNLEAMFFPVANINHQFDEIVMGCAELINTYTVESDFNELRIKRSLVKSDGQIRADLHSSGNIFQFEFYGNDFPQEFKIEFSGESKPFKVVYEIDTSNPNGHLTLFSADSDSLIIKELKEMLKRISDSAFVPKNDSSDIEREQETAVPKTAPQVTTPKTEPKHTEPITDRLNCNCPVNPDDINPDSQYLIEHFSDKVTRHFHIAGKEQATIYQCKYCETYLLIESHLSTEGEPVSAASHLNEKTANYLLNISDQLLALVQEKGVGVIKVIISGSAL